MERSEDQEVVAAAARVILDLHHVAPSYAAGFCGASTIDLAKVLSFTNTVLVERRFASAAKGMAFARIGGGHVIAVDTRCSTSDGRFTLRHELAHVLRGEATEPTFLTSEDVMSHPERVADLFAVADLTPTGWLKRNASGPGGRQRPWRQVTLDVAQAYREMTEGWSEQRLWDRARLRVLLFREIGI